jgi:hypothetical protein
VKLDKSYEHKKAHTDQQTVTFSPSILFLGEMIQHIPWEGTPFVRNGMCNGACIPSPSHVTIDHNICCGMTLVPPHHSSQDMCPYFVFERETSFDPNPVDENFFETPTE